MKVAVACDHAGVLIKEAVLETIQKLGHEPIDLGTSLNERVDFPDYAEKAGRAIQSGQVERAVVMCGSGVGMCIAINKMAGIYASVCHDTYSARQGVEHDNMNALCLGGRVIGPELVMELVSAFLNASYLDKGNYQRRFNKVKDLETREKSK